VTTRGVPVEIENAPGNVDGERDGAIQHT